MQNDSTVSLNSTFNTNTNTRTSVLKKNKFNRKNSSLDPFLNHHPDSDKQMRENVKDPNGFNGFNGFTSTSSFNSFNKDLKDKDLDRQSG